ncbi:MAG: HAD family hydrolase [Candidatus Limnocylindrales bacterium]
MAWTPPAAEDALRIAWRSPDPVLLAHPLTDLRALFLGLRAGRRRRIAVATSDDREPTTRTLAALGVDGLVDAVVCADDGHAGKPAGDMVRHLCTLLGVDPGRAAVVGDSPADMAMGRAGGLGSSSACCPGLVATPT